VADMRPRISVVLNTARSSYAMIDMPSMHHLEFTARHLAEQSFDVFEWIVADYIPERRDEEPWWFPLRRSGVPVYHVPVRKNVWTEKHHVAIATCKNSGALYAEGDLLVFLDDCCAPGPDVLKTYWDWYNKGYFAAGMHDRYNGQVHVARRDFKTLGHPELAGPTDARWTYFREDGPDYLIDMPDVFGYMSCSRAAFAKLNGFDEMLDGSRQLEDMDFGRRILQAGYHLVLDKNLVIREQEHSAINADTVAASDRAALVEDKFLPNLKCNGPWIFLKESRSGADQYRANHRPPTPAEWHAMGGDGATCAYRVFDAEGWGYCGKHDIPGQPPRRVPCNWYENKVERNLILPDSRLYKDLAPWDYAEEHAKALAQKARFRVA
jgi:hypothetical protein